jgi:hypothetical protein
MQCDACQYEFTLSEIQSGVNCPRCAERAVQAQQVAARSPAAASAGTYVKPQEVVVVDFQMSFNSMVWFMVKAALASIPAIVILTVIFFVLQIAYGGAIVAIRELFP